MQSGALSVADKEALGAKVLRQLDMEHYKECLKRSYLDGPGASILQAQTSIEKAREQNLAQQARGQKMAAALHLIPEPRSFWSDRGRAAFEQNVFAPEYEMDDAMAIDHEAVITEYKEMKGFLQTINTRQFAPKLYSELPETPVKELDLDGQMVGPAHPAFKLALLTRMCNHHFGELRQFGGVWRLAWGRFNPPKWAKQLKREELIALETRTHPADLRNWNFTPCLYTEEDVKKQVEAGLRPAPKSIRGGFWAPYDEERYWQRQTQTWTLPALFHVYGNSWTMKELYGIWCEMPLMIQRSRRGQGETAKEHQANLQKTKDEVQQFLDANNLGRPQSPAEWRQCYKELGKFLAMRAFLTNTPQVVLEIPVAPITDDREHMIMRAICDERISLALDAFKEHPEIYQQIVDILPADQLMDVKVAWRCNTTQYWHAEVDAAAAGPLYAKLGYSASAIEAMNLNPFGGHVNLTAQGAKLLGEEPAYSGHPNPGARQSGHSPAPFITIEGDDGKDYEAERKPPITVNNVVSACGKDYMRKSYPRGASAMPSGGAWNVAWFWAVSAPGKWSKKRRVWHVEAIAANGARVFGRERWGAPAFSRSPRGMWSFRWSWMSPLSASTTDGSRTASSSTSGWNQQLLSAMCPWRLIPTRCTAWGSASPMGWAMWVMPFGTLCWRILRRPAWKASTMWRTSTSGTECIRGGHLPFCLFLFLHWGSWILLVARWFFCNTGDHDVSS